MKITKILKRDGTKTYFQANYLTKLELVYIKFVLPVVENNTFKLIANANSITIMHAIRITLKNCKKTDRPILATHHTIYSEFFSSLRRKWKLC